MKLHKMIFSLLCLSGLVACSSVHTTSEVSRSLANNSEFPLHLTCADVANTLEIVQHNDQWWASNSNHFSDEKKQNLGAWARVKIESVRENEYLISALGPNIFIATSSWHNYGDIPFKNMTVKLSKDYDQHPSVAQFQYKGSFVTYSCCPKPLMPGEGGQGQCR